MDDVTIKSYNTLVLECNASTESKVIAIEPSVLSKTSSCTIETPKKSGINKSKNSSLEEDLLGANSLLMSDTDDDYDTCAQEKNNHKSAGVSQISCMEVEENSIFLPTKREISNAIICEQIKDMNNGSDATTNNYDLEPGNETPMVPTVISSKETNHNQHFQKTNASRKKMKKFSAILDSESDEDDIRGNSKSNPAAISKLKFSALIDTDSDDSEKEEPLKSPEKSMKNRKFNLIDSDSDRNEKSMDVRSKKLTKKSHSRKAKSKDFDVDLNSDLELSEKREMGAHNCDEKEDLYKMEVDAEEQAIDSKKKPMRASAKKALDDMQVIQSEQQRLHREADISVPYHKPRRHTLQEFLTRRTIIKPAAESECSPAAAILKKKSLKMTPEELEEYAKLMEERAKEAKEFFKSETESDEEELKVNTGAMEEEHQNDDNIENMGNNMQCPDNNEKDAKTSLDNEQIDVSPSQTANTGEQGNSETDLSMPQINSKVLVTEVLELPNLDLSTLHVNEMDENTPVSVHMPSTVNSNMLVDSDVPDLKRQALSEKILNESPSIKGDPNMIIDLESGDLIEKKPTGADNLLQRLLATHRARKTKTSETVNILSNENGKFEMTKVSIPLHDDDAVIKEQKPGASYVKLKENLKSLIRKKRLEEKQKKLEDEIEYKKCLEGDGYDDDEDEDIEKDFKKDSKKSKKNNKRFDEILIDDEENTINDYDDNDYMEEESDDYGAEPDGGDEKKYKTNETEVNGEYNDAVDDDYDEIEVAEDPDIPHDEETSDGTDKDSSDSDDDNIKIKNVDFNKTSQDTQRKSRIIKAFANDSDADGNNDDDDDMGLLKTQVSTIATNLPNQLFGIKDSPEKSCMSLPCSDIGVCNTQELLSLCSGTFNTTQDPSTSESSTVIISQIPITQRSHLNDMSDELLGLCSGTFDENSEELNSECVSNTVSALEDRDVEKKVEAAVYKILSSDEEDRNTKTEEHTRKRLKKLRKKLKKRQVKLGFSDDEDENDPVGQIRIVNDDVGETECDHDNDEENENDVEIPETYIEYDSEENEIVVEMTKKDCIKRAENFFENEAELSESDWGSADEDEKNMDQYDIELGDEDEFDRGKLQQELGQIHARKVLDDDIREVRKIQELLFEDEEADGVGRQRQFRWKNAENGFSLDDIKEGGEDGINGESGDEEQKQEHMWRKIRFEREQLLKEQGLKESGKDFLTATLNLNSPLTTIIANSTNISKNTTPILGSNGKKFQIITKKMTSTVSAKRNSSPFLISSNSKITRQATIAGATPPMSNLLQPKMARGSFLTRDKETLTKFANFSRSANGYDDEETAGTVSVKSKNFVFTTLTKEEHEHLKRKADDLMNNSAETGTNFMKKPRTNAADKQCLIDQLLM